MDIEVEYTVLDTSAPSLEAFLLGVWRLVTGT